MKNDKVYVILGYKGKKLKHQLLELEAYEKKSDAEKRLKNIIKEKHKEDKKSEYWKEGANAYGFNDGDKNEYYYWVEELVIK